MEAVIMRTQIRRNFIGMSMTVSLRRGSFYIGKCQSAALTFGGISILCGITL